MAVRLVEGGLQSYLPEQDRQSLVRELKGGGTSSTARARATAQLQAQRQAEAQKLAERQAEIQRQQQIQQQAQQQVEAQKTAQQQQIIVQSARGKSGQLFQEGRVTVGGNVYVGSSIVPGTGGKTATEYRRQIEQQAVERGEVKEKEAHLYRYTITPGTPTEETKPISLSWDTLTTPIDISDTPKFNLFEITKPAETPISRIGSEVKDFFFTKPSLAGVSEKGFIRGGLQTFKFYAFQPLAGIAQEFKKGGEEIKTYSFKGSEALGITLGGIGTLIPETPAGQITLVGGAKIFSIAPKVLRIGVGGYFTYTGTKTALDISATPEQRVAGGIVGVLGASGVLFETLPYIRGGIARLSPSYKTIKTQPEGFSAIEVKKIEIIKLRGYTGGGTKVPLIEYKNLPFKIPEQTLIGLIPEKSPLKTGVTSLVELPSISPLKRGGFGVQSFYKELFLGKQTVTTSQIGFFKVGKDIPFQREFFVSPQEPFIKIPETRVSRLGIESLFEFKKTAQISFGLPGQPQIGIEKGATVLKIEKGGAYRIGTGTELEAIKSVGIITDITKLGVTTFKGVAVKLFKFKTTPGAYTGVSYTTPTTTVISRVSGEALISSSLGLTRQITTPTTPTIPITTPIISISMPSYTTPYTIPTTIITPITTRGGRTTRVTPITTIVSLPKSIPSPPFIPYTTPRLIPTPPSIPYTTPKPPYYTTHYKTPPITKPPVLPFLRGKTLLKQPLGKFPVYVRRFGKWKSVGFGKTEEQALLLGKQYSFRTLGRSFYVPGVKPTELLPGFRTKKEKGKLIYIQKAKYPGGSTLASLGEKAEIKFFRGLKSPTKKKKKRGFFDLW